MVLKNKNLELNKELASHKTIRKYTQPRAMTDFMQNSFLNISIKTLNLFLEKIQSKSKHAKSLDDKEKERVKSEITSKYNHFCDILYKDFQYRFQIR